ncbi:MULTISPECIES: type II toxin-antitoxin system VapC family toxin [unclassified Mesotoga]|jgi:tRNA(fMet)-specific endonuclease VapC|uniref:type II toxin-antitoxin system VapC family toxin n=1 Tax=unclassified Mesotoga TaxID=1184398 RepID=UPI000EF1456D|nr:MULTISPECIES: type II toxin-antitoxin system VapC family toxin [unclassified Mesotoga]RLL86647.1 twitching motility protein PilT [Mesotoga sp. H07pep.5.4]HRX65966.1 type II toxin-antitoxin system VapC family toxin [Mesotoga sp.]
MSDLVLLDTDILSMFFRGHPSVVSRMEEYTKDHEKIYLSIITYYEILSGLRHIEATRQIEQFLEFCLFNEILPITLESASIAAKHYANLRKLGTPLADMDLLIAGIAIENNMTLITHNMKHFSRIPGIKVQDWGE